MFAVSNGFESQVNAYDLMSEFKLSKTSMRRVLDYGCEYEGIEISYKIRNNRIAFDYESGVVRAKKTTSEKGGKKKPDKKEKPSEDSAVVVIDEVAEIVDYLNNRTGKNFRPKNNKTTQLIKARIKEGFGVEDFKVVIDKKTNDWLGSDYNKYLRPETLFGNKFESYLNEQNTQNGKSSSTTRSSSFDSAIERADAINYEILNQK
jgi:uncharacterized phage protein (TIGR02220 family)